MGLHALDAAHQVDAAHDIAPLVRAAHLDLDIVGAVQVHEVIALQELVGKLGEGDALIAVLDAVAHRILGQHGVDREVLAHIAQETDHIHLPPPVGVVDVDGLRPVGQREQAFELLALALDIGLDHVFGLKIALGVLAGRVANEARRAAQEHHNLTAALAVAVHAQKRHQIARMQARRARIKAHIHRRPMLSDIGVSQLRGLLVEKAAGFHISEEGRGFGVCEANAHEALLAGGTVRLSA